MKKELKIMIGIALVVIIIAIVAAIYLYISKNIHGDVLVEYRSVDDGDLSTVIVDFKLYEDGTIEVKSPGNYKFKEKIKEIEVKQIKEKLKEINYMNLPDEVILLGTNLTIKTTLRLDGQEKVVRLLYDLEKGNDYYPPYKIEDFYLLLFSLVLKNK